MANAKALASANDSGNRVDGENRSRESATKTTVEHRRVTAADLARLNVNANDNRPLTILDILRDPTPTRVYNLEIESRMGEITHNFLVGDEQAWVHNAGIGRNDPRRTWLYKLFDAKGNFLKWGITINPKTRYPKCEKYKLITQKCGCRSDMLDDERDRVETDPGPLNREPWAGRRKT